jgi:serine/threonine protein kinase
MADLVGHQLGQYLVTAHLGKGGMSTVYEATQASMKRTVAIKILPGALMHQDNFLQRFYREVEVIASLQHPHIVPVYDFGEYNGMPYIVMANIKGGTLGDLINDGPMNPGDVTRIVQQMADALDYAHSKGIIHRDFKPSNVLLDEQRNSYLADFGLAKLGESPSQITGTGILGTPTYMSPEQAQSSALTSASDVYALGVTIFQMLTGRVPFDAPTPLGVIMAHVTQPVPTINILRPELPGETQAVIERSMAKEVEARFSSPGALANALSYALKIATDELEAVTVDHDAALLMTNMIGQVIFLDLPCLWLLRRRQSDMRALIGKPLHEVVGIPKAQADQIIQQIGKSGQLEQTRLDIKDGQGLSIGVWCKATATRDDKGAFIGADITLEPLQKTIQPIPESSAGASAMDTTEESFLQAYFIKQMGALRQSLVQLGGPKVGRNLDRIINETAARNVWPVSITNEQITVNLRDADIDVYRALLAKALAYVVSLVGKKMALKGLQAVDQQLDERLLNVAKQLRIKELFEAL